MKLIIAGSTGLVATSIIQQSLQIHEITSIIALSRKPLQLPSTSTSTAKLKTIIVKDYASYPEEVKAEFKNADACIWTVAVTPMRSRNLDFAEVKHVCQTCALAGFKAMYESGTARPFRFVYVSAEGTPRDMGLRPWFMGEYQVMRGETENMVLAFAKEHEGIEICIAKPGMVTSSVTFWRAAQAYLFGFTNLFTRVIPNVSRVELAAVLLSQVVRGFEKETLTNADLVRMGRAALKGL